MIGVSSRRFAIVEPSATLTLNVSKTELLTPCDELVATIVFTSEQAALASAFRPQLNVSLGPEVFHGIVEDSLGLRSSALGLVPFNYSLSIDRKELQIETANELEIEVGDSLTLSLNISIEAQAGPLSASSISSVVAYHSSISLDPEYFATYTQQHSASWTFQQPAVQLSLDHTSMIGTAGTSVALGELVCVLPMWKGHRC